MNAGKLKAAIEAVQARPVTITDPGGLGADDGGAA
jgi:hypothetical protein